MKSSVSTKLSAFYKKLKNDAINSVTSFSGLTPRDIKVIGNSANYPDSVAVSMDDICDASAGVVFARYDEDNHFVKSYAVSKRELMDVYRRGLSDNVTIMCNYKGRMSRTDQLDGKGELTRIPWTYLDEYAMA